MCVCGVVDRTKQTPTPTCPPLTQRCTGLCHTCYACYARYTCCACYTCYAKAPQRRLFKMEGKTSLFEAMDIFQEGDQGHIALIVEPVDGAADDRIVGIATLEDIIEELLQEEIVDETDVCVNHSGEIKRRAWGGSLIALACLCLRVPRAHMGVHRTRRQAVQTKLN